MEPITSVDELKDAIQMLEFDHALKKLLFKEQVNFVFENLKPVNLLKSTLQEITSSPHLVDNILGATVGLASGYLSKKIVIGGSVSIIRKLLGSLIQFGVTTVVSQNPDTIKSIGRSILQHFLRKKEMK